MRRQPRAPTSTYLTLIEYFLRDFVLKHFRRTGLFQHLILSQRQKALENKLPDREANDELLPREQGPIEELCEALGCVNIWSGNVN